MLGILLTLATIAEPLPGTGPLPESKDRAAEMVEGLHVYLDRAWSNAREVREAAWRQRPGTRERLAELLGVRLPAKSSPMEFVGGPKQPSLLHEDAGVRYFAVRLHVEADYFAEGLLLEPSNPRAAVVAVPDCTLLPEDIAGLTKTLPIVDQYARRLAESGCRVFVPYILERDYRLSGNPRLGIRTNQSAREFIYRMAYEMGRHIIGYELGAILGGVAWFRSDSPDLPIGVVGWGDGGMAAFWAGALDERISVVLTGGFVGTPQELWKQPIERNVWSLVKEFGEAEVQSMYGERRCLITGGRTPKHPPMPTELPSDPSLRRVAAPGELLGLPIGPHENSPELLPNLHEFTELLAKLPVVEPKSALRIPNLPDPAPRKERCFHGMVELTQRLWRESERERRQFWSATDKVVAAQDWEAACAPLRKYFAEQVIGTIPSPSVPMNPRSRRVYDEADWSGWEVTLDLHPNVFASGILLVPKNLAKGERRAVVVCQHGLEGTPRSCIDPEKRATYGRFAVLLVRKGYLVYCPQNPYYGGSEFRRLQRKANPLGLSLFSFIVAQHARTLEWLKTLPNVDPQRIGFYGLSYGGKTAMRVPALLPDYCLSICSGDFNEWIGKNVSIDLPQSYMFTGEYEMPEFALGRTFNYAEMAYLIAPRPFMVERGHLDGVGTDEMVAYEYAKVRFLYAHRLRLPERTEIEFFNAGHIIHAKGTFDFLDRHLRRSAQP